MKYIFFGTPSEAVLVLDILGKHDFSPALVVTAPDRPSGRGLHVTESPVAAWAATKNIETYKPESLRVENPVEKIRSVGADFGIVLAYGKIIPQSVIDCFPKGILNIHPSLLPLYRGPAPVEGAILDGAIETGVSVMMIDSDMDHGPILAQEKIAIDEDETAPELLQKLVRVGAEKLAALLLDYLGGKISLTEQDHSKATFTKKIAKSDGEISLSDNPTELYGKYRAYAGWPGIYYYEQTADAHSEKTSRVLIKKARFENGQFIPLRVLPEGKKEIDFANFAKKHTS